MTSYFLNLKSLDNTNSCLILIFFLKKYVTIHVVVRLSMMFKDQNLEKYKASRAISYVALLISSTISILLVVWFCTLQ